MMKMNSLLKIVKIVMLTIEIRSILLKSCGLKLVDLCVKFVFLATMRMILLKLETENVSILFVKIV
jgi:hypothetical protein